MLLSAAASRPGSCARFREALQAGRTDVRLLAPTATLVDHLRHGFAREGFVVRPESIQTLARFAASLAPDARVVSQAMFHLIVEDALRRVAPKEFAAVADAPGFPASLAQTIWMLDTAGCTPAAVTGGLAAVWKRAEEDLRARELVTRTGLLRIAAKHDVGEVLLEGFSAFSDPELEFLRGARTRACSVETRLDASAPPERFAAETVERESEEIARRIVHETNHGRPFRDIGVALRNPEAYRPILEAAFERFGIPARFYFTSPASENPAAAFLAATIEALLSGWDLEKSLAALRLAPSLSIDWLEFQLRKRLPARGLEEIRSLTKSEAVLRLLDDWERITAWRERKLAPADWARALSSLRSLFRPGRIEEAANVAILRSQPAALDAFSSAMNEAAEWSASPMTLAEFWRIAHAVLRMTPLRIRDGRRNVVHVMSVYEARQWDLGVLFLCGMAEREFPRRHPQNPFLSDAAIQGLQRAGFRVQTSDERDTEEEALFTAAAQSARDRLILSYARERKNLPSPLYLAAGGEESEAVTVRPAPRPERKWQPASAIANSELLTEIARRSEAISVTRLESYLQCPFQFFANALLKLRPAPPRPEDRLDALTQGNIVHRVLAEWFAERPPIVPLFERIFAETCEKLRIPACYQTERLRLQMRADLERFARDERWPRGHPALAETEIELPLVDGVTVRARIDRLETLSDGSAAIVDYKYSGATLTKKKTEDETKLQGPLYVLAVQQTQPVSAMVYYSLRNDARPFGWGGVPGLDAKLTVLGAEWLENGLAQARRAVEELRRGRIHPQPAALDPCRYCDFRDACRYEQTAALTAARA